VFVLLTAFGICGASSARAVPSFTLEGGNRLINASPESITGTYGTSLRLYFIREFRVLSATSTDGLTWTEEAGVRVSSESFNTPGIVFSSVTSASVLPLDGSGFAMTLTAVNASGNFGVISATSTDGLNWGIEGISFVLPTQTYAGSARLVEETGGFWRLYYVRPFSTGYSSSTFRVFTATSANEGQTWGGSSQSFDGEAHSVTPSVRTDGVRRIFYTQPLTGSTTATQVLSALETAGARLGFSDESGVRLGVAAGSGRLGSLLAFRSSESFRWRLYADFTSTNTVTAPVIDSALTKSPDVQGLSPSSIARTAPAGTFTYNGEIFSSSMTARLTRTGEADTVGTAVTTSNDQTVTVVFNTENASLGLWTLVVQNSDGESDTLSNALEITFAPGIVSRVDNVFRPLRSQKVHFDVTVFNPGRVTAEIFTLDGRKLKTLFDGDVAQGTTGLDWDARTDDGNVVASGVYLVTFTGPRLETREKIVVIK